MKKLLSIIMFAVGICVIAACSKDDDLNIFCSLYGTVTDASTGEPVSAATITLAPGGKTTVSGSDGSYTFDDIQEGQYTVTVQKVGYSTNRKTVNAVSGQKVKADIPLSKGN